MPSRICGVLLGGFRFPRLRLILLACFFFRLVVSLVGWVGGWVGLLAGWLTWGRVKVEKGSDPASCSWGLGSPDKPLLPFLAP